MQESFSASRAYWNQRFALAKLRERILALSRAVDHPGDLTLYQFAQLMAAALEFAPDWILELGRGKGNSTCAFTEVANQLGPRRCRVVSLCYSRSWEEETLPRLRPTVSESWFAPLLAVRQDLLTVDYRRALAKAERVLVFWDAHGFDVAECVLGAVLPELASRRHLVIMHDLSDARYMSKSYAEYGDHGLWRGNDWSGPTLRIGHIDSKVEQAVAITDFTSRNELTLHSADHSFHTEWDTRPQNLEEMRQLLGDQLFSLQGHWFWFTLNEHPEPYTFPRFQQRHG